MLCLGPGSSCDVCLDPFGDDSKAPCSIECGHVFCSDCLDHITRQTCPLCRESFDVRSAVKLHVDVDGCGAAQSATYAQARRLQRAIADVANEGATEPRLRQLLAECKTFLQSQSRELFEDLRVSHRMLAYLCEVRSKLRAQGQEVARVEAENQALQEDIMDLRIHKEDEIAQLEAEKVQKEALIVELERLNREERDRARDAELEARRKGMEMQGRYIEQLEIANKLRADLDDLRKDFIRVTAVSNSHHEPADVPLISINTPPSRGEESMSLKESYSGPEQDYMISPFPEFTNTTLPMEFSTLPTIEDQQEETSAEDSRPGCGAAGCPLSCSCQSAQLFSLNGQTSTPPDLPSPGAPSLLSLTAPRADDSPRSLSSYSPSTPSDRPTIEDMQPTCTPSPPPHNQVERLRELLTDASPSLTSSMPNLAGSYKAESQLSSRRPIPSRSLESSSASLTTQPISVPSVQPSASVTPEVTTAISLPFQPRSGLSSASRAAYALENAQRLNKEKQKAERERKRAERLEEPTVDESSRNPSRPVSGVLDAPADSNNATSKSHSYYDATGSKGHYQSYHGTGAESQRSSYSNPSQLTSKMEARSSRPKHESYYSAGTDGDRSPYPNPSSGSSKTENRASRSNSRAQQEGSSQGSGMEPERSSYSNPPLLSSKMESHASRSSSRAQQEASNNASVSADRPNPPPIPTSSKPESRASRSSSKTQQDSQSSTKSYIPIQRDSYNYNSVSASASSSYRDYDSAMYANTPPTASNLSRQSSSSMTSMQTKPTTSSTNVKDSSNSYRQYSSSSGKNKLVPTSSLSASIGYAHA